MNTLEIGSFVQVLSNNKGIGKLKSILVGNMAEVTYFHSISDQETNIYSINDIKKVVLQHQSRCYFYQLDEDQWVMGRALRKIGNEYEVDFPDRFSMYISQNELYVRCEDSLPHPTEVLSILGQETAFFYTRRTGFMENLIDQRAVAKGMTGLISSNIDLVPHQIEVIRRVLEDPIPRYLLADEVGLGKTIEAGVILRQMLLDEAERTALVLVPSFLLVQWEEELTQRCLIGQFPGRVRFTALETFDFIEETLPDIVIIDEAHEVAKLAFSQNPHAKNKYEQIRYVSHHANALLLLSATPVLNNEKEFLSMLHLLDPDNYKLNELDAFRQKLMFRQDIGKVLLSFRENTKSFLLKRGIANLRTLFKDDGILESFLQKLEMDLDTLNEEKRGELIRKIRLHISETYRLHRRMLRNRRESVGSILQHSRSEQSITEQFDLDERTEVLHQLLDEYRYEAWASERHLWENEQTMESNLSRIWFLFLETAGSDDDLFCKLIRIRLTKEVEESLASLDNINLLINTELFQGELELLQRMLNVFKYPSEEGDKLQLLLYSIKNIQERARRSGKEEQKIIVFSQFTSVCEKMHRYLAQELGQELVGAYHSNLNQDQIKEITDTFRSRSIFQVLICDSSGEVGRNFQFVDHLIHYDLPFSPNRIEQRIGRLDRLGRDKPFYMSIMTGPDNEINFQYAWHSLLKRGLNIYGSSISSLQFFVDSQIPNIMRDMYVNGIQGLKLQTAHIVETIEQEKVKVTEQQIIDEIDAKEKESSKFYEDLVAYEKNPTRMQSSVEPWLCEALSFQRSESQNDGGFHYKGTQRTLVPSLRMIKLQSQMDAPGFYDRNRAVRTKGSKLFRIGDPFFDSLSDYLRWDDRGQTYAMWRHITSWPKSNQDWLGFQMHYIVEGDSKPIQRLLESRGEEGKLKVYKRLLDKFFSPHYMTIQLDYQGEVADASYVNLMTAPYKGAEQGGKDTNIIKERLRVIRDTFSTKTWNNICSQAEQNSREHLYKELSFKDLCDLNAAKALRYFKDLQTQIELRNSYEGTWGDYESLDNEIYEAVLEGIKQPDVILDAAGFIVLSARTLNK
ncbi:protein DpdE [Paenibacillus sp. LS1]|uniref:protein DpdE n=1 Tax=Paenibacillus sp. LS1 TaxID=2992120 RepID=UPI002230F5A8|nr:protein DpdE [Paenibacillus sp. LS1]MCW3795388.1 protein DpdE [Paenibacillus sp. LS1]